MGTELDDINFGRALDRVILSGLRISPEEILLEDDDLGNGSIREWPMLITIRGLTLRHGYTNQLDYLPEGTREEATYVWEDDL